MTARPALIGFVAALVAGVAYWVTLVWGVGWGDGAELALQAHRLGVTHPPGYPLHTWLGHLFGYFAPEPAAATLMLSFVATLVAIGVLAALTTALAGPAGGLFAGLLFAAHPYVWEAATHTEVYNVAVAVLAIAVALVVWPGELTTRRAGAAGAVAALSLAASPANALTLPGFLVLLSARSPRPWRGRLITFLGGVAVVGALVLLWTFARAAVHPPLGTPADPTHGIAFARFLTGVDYGVLSVRTTDFYLERTLEHPVAFVKDFSIVGALFCVVGALTWWRRERAEAAGLLLMALGNAGYFTYHLWPDYRAMVTPATLIAALGAGVGFGAWIGSSRASASARFVIATFVVVAVPLIVGFRARGHAAQVDPPGSAQTFVAEAFDVLPENAVVLTRWIHMTPLMYASEVSGERSDLRFIELADGPRHYDFGTVVDWRRTARELAPTRPIVTNAPAVRTATGWESEPIEGRWVRLYPGRARR